MFVENNMGFIEIDLLPRCLTKSLEKGEGFREPHNIILAKKDNVVCENKVIDLERFFAENDRFPMVI